MNESIPSLPWIVEVSDERLFIGSASETVQGKVSEIVCTMNYEEGVVCREIERERALFIVNAVNNWYLRHPYGMSQ